MHGAPGARVISAVLLAALAFVQANPAQADPGSGSESQNTDPEPGTAEAVRAHDLPLATMRRALAAVPALADLAPSFVPFARSDVDTALRRGGRSRGSITVFSFLPASFLWTPQPDRELWIVSGRSGSKVLIAAFDRRDGDRLEHAASLILDEPDATVAVGYTAETPGELRWTTCYGCSGEGGTIRLGADGRAEFTYR